MMKAQKKFSPHFSELYDKAIDSMTGRPKDPHRESAKQIADVFPSRDCRGTREDRYTDFRGRISGDKRGQLSRKEWEARMLAKDLKQLRREGWR